MTCRRMLALTLPALLLPLSAAAQTPRADADRVGLAPSAAASIKGSPLAHPALGAPPAPVRLGEAQYGALKSILAKLLGVKEAQLPLRPLPAGAFAAVGGSVFLMPGQPLPPGFGINAFPVSVGLGSQGGLLTLSGVPASAGGADIRFSLGKVPAGAYLLSVRTSGAPAGFALPYQFQDDLLWTPQASKGLQDGWAHLAYTKAKAGDLTLKLGIPIASAPALFIYSCEIMRVQ